MTVKFTEIRDAMDAIEARGIECRRQGDEICVHIYGNNERAMIYPANMFLNWANYFLNNY